MAGFSATTFVLSKGVTASVVAGVDHMEVNDQTLTIVPTNGSTLEMTFPIPIPNGVKNMYIDTNNHLIAVFDNNEVRDCVEVPTGEGGSSLQKIIVDTLPTEGIVSNAIYFVPCENADGDDMYDEYVYINGQWERQGTRDSAIETIESAKATSSEIDELFK